MTFDEAYAAYNRPLRRWVAYRFGEDIAEDVTQETFMQALLNWSKVEDLSNLRRWLWGIAKHVAGHMLRSKSAVKRGKDLVIEWSDDVLRVASNVAPQGVSLYVEQLRHHFEGLGPAQRVALEGLAAGNTPEEIAAETGQSSASVRVAASAGRKRLREKLNDTAPYVWN